MLFPASRRLALSPKWTRDILWRRARAVPSLDLRFADNKSLVDATTGQNLVTFTRASSGTYVDSQGVIRTATTNVIWPSEDFGTNWSLASATRVTDAGIAPNGTLTADRIESTGGGVFRSGVSVISGVPYTYSVYVKHVSGTGVLSSIGFERFGSVPLAGQASFNVLTGTVVSNGAAVTASSIIPVGDGWYRVSVRATSTDITTIIINYASASGNQFLLWGAQLEQSSTVGEYIPTTSTINSAPRFDHSPTTGESLGLLVEEQRTNLLFQSENFGTTWVPFGLLAFGSGSTLNAASAPDGQTTADLIVENTANAQHNISQAITTTGAKRFSVFAKQGSGTRLLRMVDFNPTDGGLGETHFNLSTGTVVSGTGSIQAFPNGWYRCSIQSTTTVTSTYYLSLAPNNTTFTYTGDGTSGIYLWGAQLEAGAFPTSYIPTTTAAATRSADVASITGSNFSSWYRQDEGTVFVSARTSATHGGVNSFPRKLSISDGTNNNSIEDYTRVLSSYTDAGYRVDVAGVNQVSYDTNDQRNGQSSVVGYSVNNFALAVGGTVVNTDSSGTIPTTTLLRLGQRGDGSAPLNGTIRRLTYWPRRLPNEILQGITQ